MKNVIIAISVLLFTLASIQLFRLNSQINETQPICVKYDPVEVKNPNTVPCIIAPDSHYSEESVNLEIEAYFWIVEQLNKETEPEMIDILTEMKHAKLKRISIEIGYLLQELETL